MKRDDLMTSALNMGSDIATKLVMARHTRRGATTTLAWKQRISKKDSTDSTETRHTP